MFSFRSKEDAAVIENIRLHVWKGQRLSNADLLEARDVCSSYDGFSAFELTGRAENVSDLPALARFVHTECEAAKI